MEMKGEKTRCASLPYLKCIIIIIGDGNAAVQKKVGIENLYFATSSIIFGFFLLPPLDSTRECNGIIKKVIK